MARPKVVLVEADPEMQDMLRTLVEELDSADAAVAEDAAAAMKLVQQTIPDLIIVDDDSPQDGVQEVMNRLKADPDTQFVPVVALTHEPERVSELTSLGVVACLRKPFDVISLAGLVEWYAQSPGSSALDGREAA